MQSSELLMMRVEDPISGTLVVCQIAQACVRRKEPQKLAHVFEAFGEAAENLTANAGKLIIGIDGYDDVPEEIFEIDEIREFIVGLTKMVPWWFVMLHPSHALPWLYCITPKPEVRRVGQGGMFVAQNQEVIFEAMNAAIAAAEKHIKDISIETDDAEVMVQNMLISANYITRGLDPAMLDPNLSKAARESLEEHADKKTGQK